MKQIKVAVFCRNAGGELDFVFHKISCTEDEYNNGDHYESAKAAAESEGYDAIDAFDENDPAASALEGMVEFFSETST